MPGPDVLTTIAMQHPAGIITRRQILRCGATDREIHRWVRDGVLERHAPGHFRLASLPPHPQFDLHLPMTYLWDRPLPAPARLSGAAGLRALQVGGVEDLGPPLVLLPSGSQVRVRNAPWRTRYADLRRDEGLRLSHLRVASAARVLADLAEDGAEEKALLVASDELRNRLRIGIVDLMAVWRELRLNGARRMLMLAEEGKLDAESMGERRALARLFAAHPPVPDQQVQVTPRRRADFAFVFAALIVEYNGEGPHAMQMDADAMRTSEIRAPGWDLVTVTRSMVQEDQAAITAERIHRIRLERESAMLSGALQRPPLPAQPPRRTPLRTVLPLG